MCAAGRLSTDQRVGARHRSAATEASGSGNFINEHVAARLLGTTLSGTGTALRRAFVMPGFKLVLRLPEGELMTSRVRRIFLNGASVESSKTVH